MDPAGVATQVPPWFEPATKNLKYPWDSLRLPPTKDSEEAQRITIQMKELGNESLSKGDNFDALWKYEHALQVCNNHPSLKPTTAAIHSDIAAACINLGDLATGREDLLDPKQYSQTITAGTVFITSQVRWYTFAQQHAFKAVSVSKEAKSKILHQVYYQRGESLKKIVNILGVENTKEAMAQIMPSIFPENAEIHHLIIDDYVQCFHLQEILEPRVFCDVLMFAVDKGCNDYLTRMLNNKKIHSGFTTLLSELIHNKSSTEMHIQYLLDEVVKLRRYRFVRICVGNEISPCQLLKKGITQISVYQKLIVEFGMVVMAEDIVYAVCELQKLNKVDVMKLLIAHCKDFNRAIYDKAIDIATKNRKNSKQFIAALKDGTRGILKHMTAEGETCFQKSLYSEAHLKFLEALEYCRRHDIKEQRWLVRTNCAKACLNLQKYNDAYTHSMECVRLDPENYMSYFLRAEALKGILTCQVDDRPAKSYKDAFDDYIKCHMLSENLDAFYNAVILGHEHKLTKLVPRIQECHVKTGLSTQLLHKVVNNRDMTESLLKYVVFKLPLPKVKSPYNASHIDIIQILSRTTDCKLIERLLELRMPFKQYQLAAAAILIPPEDKPTFALLLKHAIKCNSEQSTLDAACLKAIVALKVEFVVLLINDGAKPPADKFDNYVCFFDDPIIQQYLAEEAPKHCEESHEEMGECKERVQTLISEAKDHEGKMGALDKYFKALEICNANNLTEDAASIHCNCAQLLLQAGSYYQAYRHAHACIKLCPSYDQAYIQRAKSLKLSLLCARHMVPTDLTFENVVEDYCEYHDRRANFKTIVDAILVAIDYDLSDKVTHVQKMPLDFCNEVFAEIITRPECKQTHLEFLVNTMWNAKELDVSMVSLEQLIVDKAITSATLLQRFLELGLTLTKEDIKMAMNCLKENQTHLFTFIAERTNPEDLNELVQVAVTANCMTFMLNFVEQSTKLPGEGSELLMQALNKKDYNVALALAKVFTMEMMDKLDLTSLMDSNIVNCPEIIEVLIHTGLNPNGKGGKAPLAMVMDKIPSISKKIELACLLLDNGADCSHLSTTPLHKATEIALRSGDLRLIDSVVRSSTFNPSKTVNDKGETPLHLAAKTQWKKEYCVIVLPALLKLEIFDPTKRDHSGKRPIDYCQKNSRSNYIMLKDAMERVKPDQSHQKKRHKKETNLSNAKTFKKVTKAERLSHSDKIGKKTKPEQEPKAMQVEYKDFPISKKLEFHIERVMAKGDEYFHADLTVTEKNASSEHVSPRCVDVKPPNDNKKVIKDEATSSNRVKEQVAVQSPDHAAVMFAKYGLDFDKLPWEVEVTAKVVRFFKNTKKSSSTDRWAAARTIYKLAEGKRSERLSKQVSSEKSLQLFEARMTKAARILWEKAISYSAKLTDTSAIPVYTQVIRVWEIILDHDDLNKGIKYCTEQIEKSHRRGFEASLRLSLERQTAAHTDKREKIRGREAPDIPMRFLQQGICKVESNYQYIPAASTNENEYNVTTFHSFDTISARSILLGTNDRRDFPFKEWQKEHEIIKLTSKEAILLLGRSGTGKTTCCLYRLWNEFNNFWNPESTTFNVKIRHKRRIQPTDIMVQCEQNACDDENSSPREEEPEVRTHGLLKVDVDVDNYQDPNSTTPTSSNVPTNRRPLLSSVNMSPLQVVGESLHEESNTKRDEFNDIVQQQSIVTSSSEVEIQLEGSKQSDIIEATPTSYTKPASSDLSSSSAKVGGNVEIIEENLHQVFITKNYVLCNQMKKHFYDMAAAYDFLDEHMKYEKTNLVKDLSKADDHVFPLFLTARQFYILLDNSFHDERTFFCRDEEGNLSVEIASLDDHEDPDILLDLEQSDSEDEEIEGHPFTTAPSLSESLAKQWTEVTALYFKEKIWPRISHQCGITNKEFDPLLVWMEIQSFIKGSEAAIRKGTHLNLEEYKQVGNRMAPNFSTHRDIIYELFLKYQRYQQKQRHQNFLFDECDLIQHLYNRMKGVQDVPWSIHSIYVDEVQDFTQAELAFLIHCCRDPNFMFFTGDTAQSIMRGITFRFQDLRSSFHRINSKYPAINVPKKPYNLTINFRSHSEILKLAGSVIDLIREFFYDSIDHLPDDIGMFPGPTPVLLESCKIEELSLLLSANKREASSIEFGAHQVILVQSKQARDNLPSILKGAIVLTIFEAKGLEFDDVLLYNFFNDSVVDAKTWRVISSYLEMPKHHGKLINDTDFPGSLDSPRSRQFDPKLHKSLNSELKCLYTAVTRAKCNLWIYDTNFVARLPIFDYWNKRSIVKVVQAQSSLVDQGEYSLVFASNSTPEQWKAQGDNFKKRRFWEQAIHCYQNAGSENEYLAKEVQASNLIQRAQKLKSPELYVEAALSLLECDDLHHDLSYIQRAAFWLEKSKPPKHHEAAMLLERMGESEKAAQSYLKGRDIENYARMKEKLGQHGGVIKAMMGREFNRSRKDALAKASEYEKQGVKLHQDLSTIKLSYSCAKYYSEKGDKDSLNEVLTYVSEFSSKIKFLKVAKLYEETFKFLVEKKMFKDAYRLAFAQGGGKFGLTDESWLQRGLKTAKENKDELMVASFVFQMAKVEYKALQARKKVCDDVLNNLDGLIQNEDQLIKAQAHLLLSMLKQDATICHTGWKQYHLMNHEVGKLEAFNQLLEFSSVSDQSLTNMCNVASKVINTFMTACGISKIMKDGLSFYGLQKIGTYFYIPEGEDIWIGEPLKSCVCSSNSYDLDGMIRLEVSDTLNVLIKHYQNYRSTWLSQFELKNKHVYERMKSYPIHRPLSMNQQLSKKYSTAKVSTEHLCHYLHSTVRSLELHSLKEKSTDEFTAVILSIFTPQVYIYLTERISDAHVAIIRKSIVSHSHFQALMKSLSLHESSNSTKINLWLTAWRISCISEPTMELLLDVLQTMERAINSKVCMDTNIPGFIYWKYDQKLYHAVSIWLKSCANVREGKFLLASKLAINHFLHNYDTYTDEGRLTVMNTVDILSIHCTGLLAVLVHISALQKHPIVHVIPLLYHSNVCIFSSMNSWKKEDRCLLSACADEANQNADTKHLFGECCQLLAQVLGLLMGTNQHTASCMHSTLGFGLTSMSSNIATKLCLILAFVIFGNLLMLNQHDSELHKFLQKVRSLLDQFRALPVHKVPTYICIAKEATRNPNFLKPVEVFKLIRELLQEAKLESTLAMLTFNCKEAGPHSKVEVTPLVSARNMEQVLTCHRLDLNHHVTFHPQETEMTIALTEGILESINPEFLDPEIVTTSLCNACNCNLSLNFNSEDQQDFGYASKELYHAHIRSDIHHSNTLLCKKFASRTSETGLYNTLRNHLTSLLEDYLQLKRVSDTDRLDQPIDDLQDELHKNDMLLSELEAAYDWKNALKEVYRMEESMDRLLKRCKDFYSQELMQYTNESALEEHNDMNRAQENKEEEVDENLSETLATPLTAVTEGKMVGLRSEDDKLKSRKRKKDRQGNNA